MQSHRGFLGAVIDLGEVATEGTVTIIPKESSRRQVVSDIQLALETGRMSTGQAAKLRGRSQWVGTLSFGRLGRLGLAVLKAIQYGHTSPELSEEEKAALRFHMTIITQIPPKTLRVDGAARSHHTLYSDAEYQPGSGRQPRLGWVLFQGAGGRPIGQTLDLPPQGYSGLEEAHPADFPRRGCGAGHSHVGPPRPLEAL